MRALVQKVRGAAPKEWYPLVTAGLHVCTDTSHAGTRTYKCLQNINISQILKYRKMVGGRVEGD